MRNSRIIFAVAALLLVPVMLEARFLFFGKGSSKYDKAVYSIEGMTCEGCEAKIVDGAGKATGVIKANACLEQKTANIIFDKSKTDPAQIEKSIDDLGFDAKLVSVGQDDGKKLCTKKDCASDKKGKEGKGCCALGSKDRKCDVGKGAENKSCGSKS